jgi:hypothetical protein
MATATRLAPLLVLFAVAANADTYEADRASYARIAKQLEAGDTMVLLPDDYTQGLVLEGLQGRPDAWIVVKGKDAEQTRLLGDPSRNTIEIRGCAYLAIEDLTIDGRGVDGAFGISASGPPSHNVRIENCTIKGHGASQSTVAISTKTSAWNWVIRGNRIAGAGTGMYLGDSDGGKPFIGGLIEHNLFLDARGYNVQIKHQLSRDATIPGIPTTPQKTIIRHNVFLKGELFGDSGERPNLLVGAQPAKGPGSEDLFEIYGNLFYHNHAESLLQAEGRVSIHDNVFVDCTGDAVHLQNHYGKVRRAHVYNNTFYDVDLAIRFVHPATEDHVVAGNLMFSNHGIDGPCTNASGNLHMPIKDAAKYVRKPSRVLGEMDFFPLPGQCKGDPIDLNAFAEETDCLRDFNGTTKGDARYRGAYAGEGRNPGWQLDANVKGAVARPAAEDDRMPPTGSFRIDGGNARTSDLAVDLDLDAADALSGMGPGAQMRFSNDGKTWSPPEPYASRREGWDLTGHGGSADAGIKVVFVRVRDAAGNWSKVLVAAIEFEAGPER